MMGWRTDRKLIVFESDDWGSIRMPSREVYTSLTKDGIDLESDEGFRYNKYDSLATSEDLASLFEVLNSVKDSSGRPVVFTPVSVMSNPDFPRILQSDFIDYFYEPFTETLKRYPGCENSFILWQEGMDKRLFMPQFHGREHLNVMAWMKALRRGHEKVLLAFKKGMWGLSTENDPEINIELQAAFDFLNPDELSYHKEVIISGLNLFKLLFGYRATVFVPPNGPLSTKLETVCAEGGIKYLSSSRLQVEPLGRKKTRIRFHWFGQKDKYGLIFLIRNCCFEPGQPGQDWIDTCIRNISRAFRWHTPSVVSTHRVNYIGSLHKQNRDNGLRQLKILLKKIVKTWPESEFITSAELGEIMKNEEPYS